MEAIKLIFVGYTEGTIGTDKDSASQQLKKTNMSRDVFIESDSHLFTTISVVQQN